MYGRNQSSLLVADRSGRAVKLLDTYGKRFVIRLRTIAKHCKRDLFTEQDRPVRRTAEVDAGMYAVSDGDVPGEFVELAVDVEVVRVAAPVYVGRKPVRARLVDVASRGSEQRTYLLTAVEEELQSR